MSGEGMMQQVEMLTVGRVWMRARCGVWTLSTVVWDTGCGPWLQIAARRRREIGLVKTKHNKWCDVSTISNCQASASASC